MISAWRARTERVLMNVKKNQAKVGTLLSFALCLVLSASCLFGCSGGSQSPDSDSHNDKKNSASVEKQPGSDQSKSSISSSPLKESDTEDKQETSSQPDDAISWKDAGDYVGESVTIYGPVKGTKVAKSSKGRPTFIDIGASYPSTDRVTCVIWSENRGNFPSSPEVYYKGKNIRVTGTLYVYNGGLNIEVSSPSQIETY